VTKKEVEWSNIVKGYEYKKGQYVVMSDEDFKRANVKASRTIEIQSFVQEAEISPEFFDSPYYLIPGKGGAKVYALLRETLHSTHRMGVAQFVLRSKQHLAAVRPEGRALMLFTLRYADELRGSSGFELPGVGLKHAGVTTKEIDLAKRLIDDMTDKWNPASFKDTYHIDLMARVKEKIKKGQTKEITEASDDGEVTSRPSNVIDLSALLKKSLDSGGRRPKVKGKPHLRVVESSKPSAKRKRA